MTSPPKDHKRYKEVHIFLTEVEHNALKNAAKAQCRSVNSLIRF
jgi:hypothetical protein